MEVVNILPCLLSAIRFAQFALQTKLMDFVHVGKKGRYKKVPNIGKRPYNGIELMEVVNILPLYGWILSTWAKRDD